MNNLRERFFDSGYSREIPDLTTIEHEDGFVV